MSEVERLREALRPFAEAWNGDGPECDEWNAWESACATGVTFGDFRRAALALAHANAASVPAGEAP